MNEANIEKSNEKSKTIEGESGATVPQGDVCQKAPEWAEHSRLHDDDEPCDDGRTGHLEDEAEKEES